jgi:hypothetical protein
MKKIITLFQRNYDGDRLVRNEIVPGAEWVVAGEGVATRKFDGTSCLVRGGKLYRRYDAKKGKTPPPGFEEAQPADPVTGHHPGWVPVGDGPEDKWHWEAWNFEGGDIADGTYELCGPKVQGNREGFKDHFLIPHGRDTLFDAPRTFDEIKSYMAGHDIEGIVWWRDHDDSDCDKVKIKKRDFGLKR